MKKIMLLLLIKSMIYFPTIINAQPDTTWTKTFGRNHYDAGNYGQQTSDGGYILAGITSFAQLSGFYLWLLKTDVNGDTIWTKTFGGAQYVKGTCIQVTSDGNYIIVGIKEGTDQDIYLLKTDSLGNEIWSKTYSRGRYFDDAGYYVQQTSDGGYIITGKTQLNWDNHCIWLIKTDSIGDTLWTKKFGSHSASGAEFGFCVQQTSDDGFSITGSTHSYEADRIDVFLAKTDSMGNTLWIKTIAGDRLLTWDVGNCFQQTSDGGYIITGSTKTVSNGSDVWLIKTDSYGNVVWKKTHGRPWNDIGYSVRQTSDDGYIITGKFRSWSNGDELCLIKTDSVGDTLWTKTIGGSESDIGRCIQLTSDGGYVVIGSTCSFGAGYSDLWFLKFNPEYGSIIDNQKFVMNNNYWLDQNYPNPFNPETTISYQLPEACYVTLRITNLLGQEIALLIDKKQEPGHNVITWNASQVSSGVYFYELTAQDGHSVKFSKINKMLLMK